MTGKASGWCNGWCNGGCAASACRCENSRLFIPTDGQFLNRALHIEDAGVGVVLHRQLDIGMPGQLLGEAKRRLEAQGRVQAFAPPGSKLRCYRPSQSGESAPSGESVRSMASDESGKSMETGES